MNKHTTTIIPIEPWLYHSPKLKLKGSIIDIGLICESLIYYEKIFINIDILSKNFLFNEIIKWFKQQDAYKDFLRLLDEGIINFVYHSFFTSPIFDPRNNTYSIWNLEDEESKEKDIFNSRVLYNDELNKIIKGRERQQLYRVIENKVIEFRADKFKDAVENARADYEKVDTCNIIVQSFVDELYKEFDFGKPPVISSKINKMGEKINISWNINFDELNKKTNNKFKINPGIPLHGIAHCNRIIKTASLIESDICLGEVMSSLVNNKLSEINLKNNDKVLNIIKELNQEVEFPDIRGLVNNNLITFKDILEIRKKALKFRKWLQCEGERDRDAIIAYHNEVAEEAKLEKFGKSILSLTGVVTGGLIGTIGGPIGGIAGATMGYGVDKFISLINQEWKPIVFGKWLTKYSDKIQKTRHP
ncbi:MAG: hypothetical protein PHE59_02215 [Patescibacteria group bacterium]|nr:hypothetical protein [Patescibacteria group bacterium]MDD5164865.1 hypothetical protein [Patescibacteria group bacterium]MDD5534934.1 hypothetical protein [Patescibacteria group bacterium]